MKTLIYFVYLSEVLNNCGFHIFSSFTNNKKTFLMKHKPEDIFLGRSKRYLIFEKGATLTIQGNIAKSVIPPAPRGLNFITEYTLSYELPSDFHAFQRKHAKNTEIGTGTATVTPSHQQYHRIVPYSPDYLHQLHSEYLNGNFIRENHSHSKKEKKILGKRCFRKNFHDYQRKYSYSNICLRRAKRTDDWNISKLTVSQKMFYELIEKWSLIHDFLPRYCFMRTLCESSELLLPYGHSLLHDIIHIFLGYTKPWAFHHKIFGRPLRQRYSIDECAKLYGLYCRVSWLEFVTNMIHGSRAADLMR